MKPQEKRLLVDQINEQMGRPIHSWSLAPMDDCYKAALFLDAPSSGDLIPSPKGTVLIYDPLEATPSFVGRDVLWVYFY